MLIRVAAAFIGAVVLIWITGDILDGEIAYSIGEPEEPVTSNSFAEAFSIWSAFSSLCCGLVIFGIRPEIYAEKTWLIKALLTIIIVGYVAGGVLR